MLYCAYCGKSFTRKEHLERHIPSHTNVKPHRCSACQLSFARRDLLQRHHSTYHEARDPMEPLPGGVPTVAGKTPIACLNCAQAKTGCDKRVPCSRCADKNLECAARFARRSSKAALRAAQTAVASTGEQVVLASRASTAITATDKSSSSSLRNEGTRVSDSHTSTTVDPIHIRVEDSYTSSTAHHDSASSQPGDSMLIDPRLEPHEHASTESSPSISYTCSGAVSPAHVDADDIKDVVHIGDELIPHDGHFNDMILWEDVPLDFGIYGGDAHQSQRDTPILRYQDCSDISSCFNSERLTSSRGSISTHTRSTSITSHADPDAATKAKDVSLGIINNGPILECAAVVAAEAGWPLARCNPPLRSNACPRTGIVHLECLEQNSRQEGTWDALDQFLRHNKAYINDHAPVIPMTSRSRDRMLAITQTFLHKALEIHRGGVRRQNKMRFSNECGLTFLVLPPSNILEYFLRNHVRSNSFFYSLVSTGCIDPNDLLSNDTASILLVLLMIAQGASSVSTAEARALSAGLIETCRISLYDIIEKDVEMSADPTALYCAALLTLAGAWSGDKWLMDIAMGQRGMYISMLKHAGMFEAQALSVPMLQILPTDIELQWRAWLQRETQNRLAYNWVMIDQELSLFHDTAPMLAVSDLLSPLPGPELLWVSANADQWCAAMQSIYGCTANLNPQLLTSQTLSPSLFDLFQDFLHGSLTSRPTRTTPQQLRLLLHPLQSLLCHLRQMLSCFSDVLGTRHTNARTMTKASTQTRLEEVQDLLQKWYEVSNTYQKTDPDCCATKTNLILYHLISLNAVTSFPEIERLARRECFDGSYWELSLRHKRCIFQREEATFHCGQVLRLLHALPSDKRPSWWAVALYRAILILWTDSISRLDPSFHTQLKSGGGPEITTSSDPTGDGSLNNGPVAIDQVTPEDPLVAAYLWGGNGTAVLTNPNGSACTLDKPENVLRYAVHMVQSSAASRLGDGIRRKLLSLGQHWQMEGFAKELSLPTTTKTATISVGAPVPGLGIKPPMLFPFHYTQALDPHAQPVVHAHSGHESII